MKMWPWKTARRTPPYNPDIDTRRPARADEDEFVFENRLAEWTEVLEREEPDASAEA